MPNAVPLLAPPLPTSREASLVVSTPHLLPPARRHYQQWSRRNVVSTIKCFQARWHKKLHLHLRWSFFFQRAWQRIMYFSLQLMGWHAINWRGKSFQSEPSNLTKWNSSMNTTVRKMMPNILPRAAMFLMVTIRALREQPDHQTPRSPLPCIQLSPTTARE